MTVRRSEPVRDVYRFYGQRAAQAQWASGERLWTGFTWTWQKPVAGKQAHLSLQPNFDLHAASLTASGTARTYTISGS